jgi:hypothetical protein
MTDDELRALGRDVILGGLHPTTGTAEEIRRGIDLAMQELSMRVAPYGYAIRPIDEETAAQAQSRELRQFLAIGAGVLVFLVVLLVVVVVGVTWAEQAR